MTMIKLSEGISDTPSTWLGNGRAVALCRSYCPTEVVSYIGSDNTLDSRKPAVAKSINVGFARTTRHI